MTKRRHRIAWSVALTVVLGVILVAPTTGEHVAGGETWGSPILLNPMTLDSASSAQVAMDNTGNATVIWQQNWEGVSTQLPDGQWVSAGSLYASRYVPGVGWGPASEIAFAEGVSKPVVAMNPSGAVKRDATEGWEYVTIAAWQQGERIYVSHVAPGTKWSPPQIIGEAANEDALPQVAVDADGNAIVVWEGTRGGFRFPTSVYASHYNPMTGWSAPGDLNAPNDAYAAGRADLAMNLNGDAVVVWFSRTQFDVSPKIWAKQFTRGVGWGQSVALHSGAVPGYLQGGPRASMGTEGEIIATWISTDVGFPHATRIYARHLSPDSGWGPLEEIERGSSSSPRVTIGADGDAIVVWEREDTSTNFVVARHFSSTDGWNAAFTLGEGSSPEVATDGNGSATVIWRLSSSINSRQFHPMSGWGPVKIPGIGSRGGGHQVAMDAGGNATVVSTVVAVDTVLAVRHAPGAGWGAATSIQARLSDPDSDTAAQVAVDLEGQALAVWRQGTGIFARRFVPGTGWRGVVGIGMGYSPQVAMNGEGQALVVWSNGGWTDGDVLFARRWTSETGWLEGEVLADVSPTNSRWLYSPSVAIDTQGNAIVVWNVAEGEDWPFYHRLYASRFVPGAGWGEAEAIDLGATPSIRAPGLKLAIDPEGRAVAIWRFVTEAESSLYANRFDPESGWVGAREIDRGRGNVSDPRLSMDADGTAVVLWSQQDTLLVRRFSTVGGWGRFEAPSGDQSSPQHPLEIATNPVGLTMVVWKDYEMCNPTCGRWYAPDSGWGPIKSIPPTTGYAASFDVEMDALGNALVIYPGVGGAKAWYYDKEYGWGPAHPLNAEHSTYAAQAAMDGMGNAVVVWLGRDGSSWGIYASRLVRSLHPYLSLTSPTESLVNLSKVAIEGITNPGVRVTVDGTELSVGAKGTFATTLDLPDGTHAFEVKASGPEGFTARTVVVTVDTELPHLSLLSPKTGASIETPSIRIAGSTEPGARVVVDGSVADVSTGGSFALQVPLTEGENVIAVTATDAAGNTATETVTVTYVRPASAFPLAAALVALGATLSATLLLLLYLGRRSIGAMEGRRFLGRTRSKRSLFPGIKIPGGLVGNAQRTPPRFTGGGLWPRARAEETEISLSAQERVVLHLMAYAKHAEAVEVPPDLTQRGIADAGGFNRRHFAQYVRPLLEEGLVEERNAHVEGALQRRKVYALSYAGWHKARGIRKRIQNIVLRVKDESGVREATLEDVLAEIRGSLSLLDIVREFIETGQVDLRN